MIVWNFDIMALQYLGEHMINFVDNNIDVGTPGFYGFLKNPQLTENF